MLDLSSLDVIKMDLEEAYKTFTLLKYNEEPIKDYGKLYQKIRFGIKIPFDIYRSIENDYVIKDKIDEIIIENLVIKLSDYQTEIEEREGLIKNTILSAIGEPDIIKGRGM